MKMNLLIGFLTVCTFLCSLSAQCVKKPVIRSKGCTTYTTTTVVRKGCGGSRTCPTPVVRRPVIRRKSSVRNSASGRTFSSRLNGKHYTITRKEQLNRDLRRAQIGTKKYVLLVQERERIALDEIHEAQKYILEHGEKNPEKYSQKMNILREEFEFISPTLEYIRNYPYAEETTNIYPVLVAIRSGKINLGDYRGKSHMRILTRIQELQKKRLLEFQKQYLENKF